MTMSKFGGLAAYREHVSGEKKAAVVEAARELFATNGFFETTVVVIARHAKVSTATLYKHYRSKEDILAARIEDTLSESNPECDMERQVHAFLERVARRSLAALTIPKHRTVARDALTIFAADI